jgi:hypothetical protein
MIEVKQRLLEDQNLTRRANISNLLIRRLSFLSKCFFVKRLLFRAYKHLSTQNSSLQVALNISAANKNLFTHLFWA